jgi:Tfp pilus assembly protein FimT
LIEMLIVVVMISLLALVAIPRFASGSDRRNMESARLRMGAALSTARQAAIQKGEPVRFLIKANRVTVRRVAGTTELISPVPLDTLYKVTVPSVLDSLAIDFNARGFAKLTSTTKIVLRRTGVADDSLVVYSTGMVQR